MASFQARIDWERLGERESKKKNVPMSTYPTRNKKIPKKFKKLKTPLWLLFKPKQVGNSLEREKIKKKSF